MSIREQFQRCRARSLCPLSLSTEAGDSPYEEENLHLETGFLPRREAARRGICNMSLHAAGQTANLLTKDFMLVRNPRRLMHELLRNTERQVYELVL